SSSDDANVLSSLWRSPQINAVAASSRAPSPAIATGERSSAIPVIRRTTPLASTPASATRRASDVRLLISSSPLIGVFGTPSFRPPRRNRGALGSQVLPHLVRHRLPVLRQPG